MKYIIMECHTGYAVLLDEEGRFLKAANRNYQIGQTVEDPVLMKEPGAGKSVRMRAVMGLVAAAACFLLVFTGYYQDHMVRDASIYLTINPSVCMELNRKGQVMAVRGMNEDGEKLLEGYRPGSRERLTVTKELIGRAVDMGYLSAGGNVVLDIDAPDDVVFQKYGVEFRTELAVYLNDTIQVEFQIIRHGDAASELSPEPEEREPLLPPVKVEIEVQGDDPAESQTEPEAEPDDPDVSDPEAQTEHSGQDAVSRENPVHSPDHDKDAGHDSSDHKENSSVGSSPKREGSPEQGGGSVREEDSNYKSSSSYGENSDSGSSSGYGEGSDYDESSGYSEGSDYDESSGYSGGSDYDESSGYGGGSDYDQN